MWTPLYRVTVSYCSERSIADRRPCGAGISVDLALSSSAGYGRGV